MTYKQAADHGWQVCKGEKGTQIEFWDVGRGKEDDGESRQLKDALENGQQARLRQDCLPTKTYKLQTHPW